MISWGIAIVFTAMSLNGTPPDDPLQQAIDLAKSLVVKEHHIDESLLKVEEAEAVDWPDGSLGCPEPGMMYTQMITPGYRVVLRTEQGWFNVHLANGHGKLCEKGRIRIPRRFEREARPGKDANRPEHD